MWLLERFCNWYIKKYCHKSWLVLNKRGVVIDKVENGKNNKRDIGK